jgi:hypothetical protein
MVLKALNVFQEEFPEEEPVEEMEAEEPMEMYTEPKITDLLGFVVIGASAIIGSGTASSYWESVGEIMESAFTSVTGMAYFVGILVYTVGSLTEGVFWTFALLESELYGFNTNLTPLFDFWAPIVEWIALIGYNLVWILFFISFFTDSDDELEYYAFISSLIWGVLHSLAHIFFVEKAVAWTEDTAAAVEPTLE